MLHERSRKRQHLRALAPPCCVGLEGNPCLERCGDWGSFDLGVDPGKGLCE